MRKPKRIGIVLPVGPNDGQAALDTLDSAIHFAGASRIVVVVDDTGGHDDFAKCAEVMSEDIAVIPAPPRAAGGYGGLWVKIAAGYRWMLERFAPEVILRFDVDALLIGSGLADRAIEKFAEDPKVGLIGAYKIASDGSARDWSWGARMLHIESGPLGLRYPRMRASHRRLLGPARPNGYIYGEHALGGGYIHSLKLADDIHARGWWDMPSLAPSRLGEDMIMGLLTVAAGYRTADFGRPEDPMAMRWRGLPAHPDELLAKGKLLTHSVRFYGAMREPEIRGIFREARSVIQNPTIRHSPLYSQISGEMSRHAAPGA
jgi:hypothetical protein